MRHRSKLQKLAWIFSGLFLFVYMRRSPSLAHRIGFTQSRDGRRSHRRVVSTAPRRRITPECSRSVA
jgi:hypothetical protein